MNVDIDKLDSELILLLIEAIDFRIKAYKKELKSFKDKNTIMEINQNCELLSLIKQDFTSQIEVREELINFMFSIQEELNSLASYEDLMNCESVTTYIKDEYIHSRLKELKQLIEAEGEEVPLDSLRTLLFILINTQGAKTPSTLTCNEHFHIEWEMIKEGSISMKMENNYMVTCIHEKVTQEGTHRSVDTMAACDFIYNLMTMGV